MYRRLSGARLGKGLTDKGRGEIFRGCKYSIPCFGGIARVYYVCQKSPNWILWVCIIRDLSLRKS